MAKHKVPKHEAEEKDQETRRTLLKGIAGSLPVILTVANRPVFGQQACTPSADMSAAATPSGLDRHGGVCTQGFSPGAWKTADGTGDGNLDQWHMAGAHPNPEFDADLPNNLVIGSHQATTFEEAFGFPSYSGTLHDAMLDGKNSKKKRSATQLQRHAAAALLNALYNESSGRFPGYMSSADVRLLYEAYTKGWSSYTNTSGYVVNISELDVEQFFVRITSG